MKKRTTEQSQPYPDPPPHLSQRSQDLWRTLGPGNADNEGRRVVFRCALEALDRADAASAEIASAGMIAVTKSTGAVHLNPLLKVEREARAQAMKFWSELHLNWKGGPFHNL